MLRSTQDNSTGKIFQQLSTPKEIAALAFEELLIFISKNKNIPEFLESIPTDVQKCNSVNLLLSSIQTGDASSAIFDNPDCHLYILYLMQENKIAYWQGITVYMYVMSLMQFTSRQTLSETDEKNKMLRDISVIKLCDNNTLTAEGERFVNHIAKIPELYNQSRPLWEVELKEYILNLPLTEQWLLQVPLTTNLNIDEEQVPALYFDGLIVQLEKTKMPFLEWRITGNCPFEKCIYLPSMSVINFVLQTISPDFMQISPYFGSIGENKLLELHKQNKHPLMLYSPKVKSNTISAHGGECGPMGIFIHDLGHTFWAGLLPNAFKKGILEFLIPRLLELKNDITKDNDSDVSSLIEKIVNILNDFDLLKAGTEEMENRCDQYLQLGCNVVYSSNKCTHASMQKIGANVFQRLYLLIETINIRNDFINDDAKKIWNRFCKAIESFLISKSIDNKVLTALKTLAKNINTQNKFISNDSVFDERIKHSEWMRMLNTESLKNLWNKAIKEKHDELLTLIIDHNFIFFSPYLPMNTDARNQLRHFLQKQESDYRNNFKTSMKLT